MRAPAISVLIIVYNRADTIGAAVRSVLAQTFTDFELVVVDDGSTDNTAQVVERFTDPRLRLVRVTPNSGIPLARNRALAEARGEYVAWLDSDDLCHPDRLRVQHDYLQRHRFTDMIGSAARKITAEGKLMKAGRVPFRTHEEIRALLLFRSAFQQSSIFGRTEAIRAVPYDPAFPVCEDVDMFARFTDRFLVENVPQFLIARRIHRGQTIRSNVERIIDRQMVISARKFARLGLFPSQKELRNHVILGGSFDQISDALIDWSETWFDRILTANQTAKIYDERALRKVFDLIVMKAALRRFGKEPAKLGRLARFVARHPGGLMALAKEVALPLITGHRLPLSRRSAQPAEAMTESRRIAFLYVGGVHHVTHTLPVAAALSGKANVEVTAFCADVAVQETVRNVLADLPEARVGIKRLRRFALLDKLGRPRLVKVPMLWRSAGLLRDYDALVSAECTSIALKRMGLSRPRFICQPHGAGDRAVSFEPRFRRFDRVLVAGPKTARRMVESGVSPCRVREVGYAKAEYLAFRARALPRPFQNDRPIILYNPHFRAALSSLPQAADIVRAITAGTDFNLIVAPHIRTFEEISAKELAEWQSMAVPGQVLVDTGSPQMIDMSHVAVADLYLGDVSSQVYEFLLLGTRPCVFVNAHDVRWEDDPDYAFWWLGEVVSADAVVPALTAALAAPDRFTDAQRASVANTFGTLEGSAERATEAILHCLEEPR